jgi:cytidine deaminase
VDAGAMVSAVAALLADRYDPANHRVACVVHTAKGFHYGIHLNSDGQDVCAESVAIANARIASSEQIDWIVSVRGPYVAPFSPKIVPPCGNCRQLLCTYCPDAQVIVAEDKGSFLSVAAKDLLPMPYVKANHKDTEMS